MGKTIDEISRLFLREKGLVDARARTPEALELKDARADLVGQVRALGKGGDLALLLAAERRFLENDLAGYANSGPMKRSLKTALAELSAAEKLVGKVASPEAYAAIDDAHSLPKNRIGAVPRDEARQFFRSHAARLLNQDKSRLEEDEKKILEARKNNMRAAEKVYGALQRKALGIEAAPAKGRGREMGV